MVHLTIRSEQMRVLRRDHLQRVAAPRVVAYLIECGLVPAAAALDLTALVLGDLLAADDAGIESDDGLNQLASYRFEFGARWRARREVAAILADAALAEDDKLAQLHARLTGA